MILKLLNDTIGINHCKIFKILAYFKNHIGLTTQFQQFFLQAIADTISLVPGSNQACRYTNI